MALKVAYASSVGIRYALMEPVQDSITICVPGLAPLATFVRYGERHCLGRGFRNWQIGRSGRHEMLCREASFSRGCTPPILKLCLGLCLEADLDQAGRGPSVRLHAEMTQEP
jgi:hypothetical protein